MSVETVPVTVKILDKEIRVACAEGEQDALIASARMLNDRMQQVRDSGKVIGPDRIAIMAALNLTHELLQQQDNANQQSDQISVRVKQMQDKIENRLQDLQQMEF